MSSFVSVEKKVSVIALSCAEPVLPMLCLMPLLAQKARYARLQNWEPLSECVINPSSGFLPPTPASRADTASSALIRLLVAHPTTRLENKSRKMHKQSQPSSVRIYVKSVDQTLFVVDSASGSSIDEHFRLIGSY